MNTVTLIVLFTISTSCVASILRVPEEYPSIQSAVEAVQSDDTVWVAIGIYTEAVVSPQVSFYLIGETGTDSTGLLKPSIDPSQLPNPQTLSCLRLNGNAVTVENFVFRNGPEMFPHTPLYEGGVVVSGSEGVFRNCVFDSIATGLVAALATPLQLEDCEFVNCVYATIALNGGAVVARRCSFNRLGVLCGPNSEFHECVFDSVVVGAVLQLRGSSLIENCLIQRHNSIAMSTIESGGFYGEILGCSFVDCRPGWRIFGFLRDCNENLLIANNTFANVHSNTQGGGAISWGCADDTAGGSVTIHGNTFTECYSDQHGKCIRIGVDSSQCIVDENRFIDNFGSGSATEVSVRYQQLRDNIFYNNGYALSSLYSCDARRNFWGDSTGPYNANYNSDGLGDRVSDSVIFESWYLDSLFLTIAETRRELPKSFSLSVYPNPFNSVARISLEVPDAFIASVELLNVLGQRVQEIHRGPVHGHHEFSLKADHLPSGIYFIHVRDIVRHSVNFSQKIALIK